MLDPLRSLAELVRTLTRSRADGRGSAAEAQRQGATAGRAPIPDPPSTAANMVDVLRERLGRRLRAVGTKDPRRAREAFVETVLAAELGDAVTLDPQMSEIVGKIARQLGEDAATNRDLALLFEELAGERR